MEDIGFFKTLLLDLLDAFCARCAEEASVCCFMK
jgi:hypothetical protein